LFTHAEADIKSSDACKELPCHGVRKSKELTSEYVVSEDLLDQTNILLQALKHQTKATPKGKQISKGGHLKTW
jgi:hypothetical protein